jgi:hypothetical protein
MGLGKRDCATHKAIVLFESVVSLLTSLTLSSWQEASSFLAWLAIHRSTGAIFLLSTAALTFAFRESIEIKSDLGEYEKADILNRLKNRILETFIFY